MEISKDISVENSGAEYRFYKNKLLSEKKYRARVRKDFIKFVKKMMVGLCVGTLAIIALKNLFYMNTAIATGVFLSVSSVAFVLSFKIIKHVYVFLVAALYLFLISSIFFH